MQDAGEGQEHEAWPSAGSWFSRLARRLESRAGPARAMLGTSVKLFSECTAPHCVQGRHPPHDAASDRVALGCADLGWTAELNGVGEAEHGSIAACAVGGRAGAGGRSRADDLI